MADLSWLYHSGGAQFRPDDPTAQEQLAQLQQYDPSASISAPDESGFSRLVFDPAKLPKVEGKQYNEFVAAPGARNAQNQMFNVKDPSKVKIDPVYGAYTTNDNVNINEAANRASSRTAMDTWGPALVGLAAGFGAFDPEMFGFLGTDFSGAPSLVNQAIGMAEGGKPNPLGIISAGLGLTGDVPWYESAGLKALSLGKGIYDVYGQKQYTAPYASDTTTSPVATTPADTTGGASPLATGPTTPVAPFAPAAPTAPTAPVAPTVQYVPVPEGGIPDTYNAAAFGDMGSLAAQVISDGSAPVATSVAPDAYAQSFSQVIS